MTTITSITLDQLHKDGKARLVRVGGAGATRRRLLAMGLVPGTTVELVAVAPLGDPLELLVKGYRLSLRKHEAQEITVEVADAADA
ncbi:MAG: ferrous iron transport protein A [Chloroflexaceae bacterium]|nr:ferrous iron transport protein A [Chloroflexaceae bacterium]